MLREEARDLFAFVAVAKERGFTKVAAKLDVSHSAPGQAIRGLEKRLGVSSLTRTTRSVASTEAGERLLSAASARLVEIDAKLAALRD